MNFNNEINKFNQTIHPSERGDPGLSPSDRENPDKPKETEKVTKVASSILHNSETSKSASNPSIRESKSLPEVSYAVQQSSVENLANLKALEIPPMFKGLDSTNLELIPVGKKTKRHTRSDFLADELPHNLPILSKSDFVWDSMALHLMTNKKFSAIGEKYRDGDAISNMEGALHTFLTPICEIIMLGDYQYTPGIGHDISLFQIGYGRSVILSAAIQPDFETREVMVELIRAKALPIKGEPLPFDFKILSPEEKADILSLYRYEIQLRNYMIYHLTSSHSLQSRQEIKPDHRFDIKTTMDMIEVWINTPNINANEIVKGLEGNFLEHKFEYLSLEMLFKTYLHQLRNEFSVLEKAAPQGYVYTIDPPVIFAMFFDLDAKLLNRMQALALKCLAKENQLINLREVGFNNFNAKDPYMLSLIRKALPESIKVKPKAELFSGPKGHYSGPRDYALVIHNNSDGFGQNIESESGKASLDAIVGEFSNASAVLKPIPSRLMNII